MFSKPKVKTPVENGAKKPNKKVVQAAVMLSASCLLLVVAAVALNSLGFFHMIGGWFIPRGEVMQGVISEKGSLLSHTAIISRELKIPSVVGVEALMDTIKTGDIVRMNGSTGEIEIIKR